VQDYKREQGIDGAAAGQIAAHRTRDKKELLSPEEVQRQHRELAGQFGYQADRVVAEALERTQKVQQEQTRSPAQMVHQAVTYARDHLFEKDSVQDRRALYETALNRGMGEITYGQVRLEFERRMQAAAAATFPVLVRPRCCSRPAKAYRANQQIHWFRRQPIQEGRSQRTCWPVAPADY